MKATDVALLAVIAGAMAFGVVQRQHRRAAIRAAIPHDRVVVTAHASPSAPPPGFGVRGGDDRVSRVASSNHAPERDTADIRRRISDVSNSYIRPMLADQQNFLVRWPDRSEGIRVWVQMKSAVPDFDERYAQVARDAFDDWREGLPDRLDFILDSATADVRVIWTNRFARELGTRVGVTARKVDQFGWLTEARITIAIHDSTGRAIPPADLAGIARHEAGHALGLGHSNDPATKMFPIERVRDVTPADRATLQLLYSLPPGPITPA